MLKIEYKLTFEGVNSKKHDKKYYTFFTKDNMLVLYTGKAVILCLSSKKEFYKKFLYEPLPVEVSNRIFKTNSSTQ